MRPWWSIIKKRHGARGKASRREEPGRVEGARSGGSGQKKIM